MSAPLFFAENVISGEEVILDEESSKHIVQVLRMQRGQKIRLTDGRGNHVEGEIADPHKKHCVVTVFTSSFVARRSPALTIGISLIKNAGRFEWFLEKATELGTVTIIPMICDRTEKQHMRYERMVTICKSAMLQSSQVWMPEIHQPASFHSVVTAASHEQKLFGHITNLKERNLSSALNTSLASHLMLIGPEGDFTAEEVALAQSKQFEGVSFGSTILRVETAGIFSAVVHAALTA